MKDIQTELERDLSSIAGHLDKRFPDHAPVVLIATGQEGHIENRVIANILADYSGHVTFTGPVIEQAHIFLQLFNYRVRWHEGAKMTYAVSGAARHLSAHERMNAMRKGGLI